MIKIALTLATSSYFIRNSALKASSRPYSFGSRGTNVLYCSRPNWRLLPAFAADARLSKGTRYAVGFASDWLYLVRPIVFVTPRHSNTVFLEIFALFNYSFKAKRNKINLILF